MRALKKSAIRGSEAGLVLSRALKNTAMNWEPVLITTVNMSARIKVPPPIDHSSRYVHSSVFHSTEISELF
ncbi:hypothetical protein TNCV_5097521 [Trichonephila clavipes]|nr:hypothetical protein TNCV_5097521 [Trichonephila clavipes]